MSNFSCVKCGGSWIDMGAMGYNTLCKHTFQEAMTTATPRTDALHFDWKDGIDMQRHELLKLSRTLEAELAQVTEAKNYHNNERIRIKQLAEEAETNPKWAFLEWRQRAEEAEAKNAALLIERDAAFKMSRCECAVEECCGNLIAADDRAEKAEIKSAALLALLEEIKGRVQFGTSTHMSSDVVKLCDAALKEGK